MVYPIVIYGTPLLRKKSEDITPDYEGLEKLIEDMFETMYSSDGIGLAAPQIGKNIRLFVIDANVMAEDDPELKGFKRVFINAQIVEESGEEWPYNEGCLSLPTIREDVKRKAKIKIKYVNEKFEECEEELDGIKARIVQHEYDHLEGVLFVDHLSAIRKKMIRRRLDNISNGKVNVNYRCKFYKKK